MQASGQMTANAMSAVARIPGSGSASGGAGGSPAAAALAAGLGRSGVRGARPATDAKGAATLPKAAGAASFHSVLKKAVADVTARGAKEAETGSGESAARKTRKSSHPPKPEDTRSPKIPEGIEAGIGQTAAAAQAVGGSAAVLAIPRPAGARVDRAVDRASTHREGGSAAKPVDGVATQTSPKILVVDLRGAEKSGLDVHGAARVTRRDKGADGTKSGSVEPAAAKPSATATATAAPGPREADSPSVLGLRAGAEGTPAERAQGARTTLDTSLAAGRFGEILRDEVVRQASLLVRGGGEGEIRLVLKPESMGEVRIRMKVTEDTLSGRILVSSAEAREIFREAIPGLEAALRAQGFQTASLDVAVSDGGRRQPKAQERVATVGTVVIEDELDRGGRYLVLTDAGSHAVNLIA